MGSKVEDVGGWVAYKVPQGTWCQRSQSFSSQGASQGWAVPRGCGAGGCPDPPGVLQVWEGRWRVIPYDVLPDWLKDNDYLLHGHRPPMPSFRACFRSIFRIHTETGNIWTHLLGDCGRGAALGLEGLRPCIASEQPWCWLLSVPREMLCGSWACRTWSVCSSWSPLGERDQGWAQPLQEWDREMCPEQNREASEDVRPEEATEML